MPVPRQRDDGGEEAVNFNPPDRWLIRNGAYGADGRRRTSVVKYVNPPTLECVSFTIFGDGQTRVIVRNLSTMGNRGERG